MHKVILYSFLLILGLAGSQILPTLTPGLYESLIHPIIILTMVGLAFIMIQVGFEFEIDKSNPRKYGWDYVVAATAAAFPWLFCAFYFLFVIAAPEQWAGGAPWAESLFAARFAAPTSAGVLFSMLAAGGLANTWLFRKARILAIFDDLDTILMMIPLTMLMVGFRWQLGSVTLILAALLWVAWKYLHALRIPMTWQWVLGYAGLIAFLSKLADQRVGIRI